MKPLSCLSLNLIQDTVVLVGVSLGFLEARSQVRNLLDTEITYLAEIIHNISRTRT